LILGFFLVIMISLLLFWSYAPAAIRTRQPWKAFELEVGAAAFVCRLALWRVRVHWRSPAF